MKKIIILIAVLTLGFVAQAVTSNAYLYWKLDPVADSLKFAYAMIAAEDYYSQTKTYLNIGDTGTPYVMGDDAPDTTDLGVSFYSQIVVDPEHSTQRGYYIELYNASGQVIGVSQVGYESDLTAGGYVYADKNIEGLVHPYHFTAASPEPTGAVLIVLGLGVLALRRRPEDEITTEV